VRTALIKVAGGLALALALSSCGGVGDGKYQDADSLVRAAKSSTEKFESNAVTMSMKFGPVTATGEGAAGVEGGEPRSMMTMSMNMGALNGVNGTGTIELEMRQLGEDVYVKMPSELTGTPADEGKPWYRTTLSELTGWNMDVDQFLQSTDPSKMIEALKESADLVDTEAGASVNGRSATKYRFEVDFRKVLQTYGAGLDNAEELAQLELDAIPLDVYLDDRDLPARVRIDFSTMFEQMIEQVGGEDTVPDGVNFDEAYCRWTSPTGATRSTSSHRLPTRSATNRFPDWTTERKSCRWGRRGPLRGSRRPRMHVRFPWPDSDATRWMRRLRSTGNR